MSESAKRRLLTHIIKLHKTRGTKNSLIEMVKIILSVDIEIKEKFIPEFILKESYNLDEFDIEYSFTVIIKERLSEDKEEEIQLFEYLKAIILKEKPVFTHPFFDYRFLQKEIKQGNIILKGYDKEYDYSYDENW